jgi:hypothetical protein
MVSACFKARFFMRNLKAEVFAKSESEIIPKMAWSKVSKEFGEIPKFDGSQPDFPRLSWS